MDVPHPDNNANNNIRTSSNAATIIEVKESHSSQGQSSSECIDIRNRKTLEFLQKKYEIMKQELCESRARIDELEQSLVVKIDCELILIFFCLRFESLECNL